MSKRLTDEYARNARREKVDMYTHQNNPGMRQSGYVSPRIPDVEGQQHSVINDLRFMMTNPFYEDRERFMEIMETALNGETTIRNIVEAIGNGVGRDVVMRLRDGCSGWDFAALFPGEIAAAIREYGG